MEKREGILSEKGQIHIYAGDGKGKSSAAIGRAIKAAAQGTKVVIIQFLKGKGLGDSEFLRRMEPELKIFHFEKSEANFNELREEKKQEEVINLRNGINFAKKVLATGECEMLVLDEILGLLENAIITVEEMKCILESRGNTHIILTGINLSEDVCSLADEVSKIETMSIKKKKYK